MKKGDAVKTRAAPLPISRDLHGEVLALNNAHAVELSWLEPGELFALLGQAFYARRVGKLDAFLLAFDQGASYDRTCGSDMACRHRRCAGTGRRSG